MREIFTRLERASSLRIFLTANQCLSYGCYNNLGLDKAWSHTLVVANQFIGSQWRNTVAANKSGFTALHVNSALK